MVLNRNLCLLQPLESIRTGRRRAEESINLEYTSLPPQLVIGNALFGKDFLLASVCVMTFLANILSVSLSGMFFEGDVNLGLSSTFSQPLATKFQAMNGSAISAIITITAQAIGSATAPFYIATANQTFNTSLPVWTNKQYYHQSFFLSSTNSQYLTRRATTNDIGAKLHCDPLSSKSTLAISGTFFDQYGMATEFSDGNLTVSVMNGAQEVKCVPRALLQDGRLPNTNDILSRPTGPSAYEFTYALQALSNGSAADVASCLQHVAPGWIRAVLSNGTTLPGHNSTEYIPSIVDSYSSTVIVCRSVVMNGTADTRVTGDGYILESKVLTLSEGPDSMFSTSASDLLGQAHQSVTLAHRRWCNLFAWLVDKIATVEVW